MGVTQLPQIKLNYTQSHKEPEMSFTLSEPVASAGVKKEKYSANQSEACPLQTSAEDTKDLSIFPHAHWHRRHSDGIEVGLRSAESDKSRVPPGPRSLVSQRGGGVETSNREAAGGT